MSYSVSDVGIQTCCTLLVNLAVAPEPVHPELQTWEDMCFQLYRHLECLGMLFRLGASKKGRTSAIRGGRASAPNRGSSVE